MNVYGKILAKIWTDPKFLDRFKADPKRFKGAESGTELSEKMRIIVREEDDHNEYLALPTVGTDSELTDAELALVSGGSIIGTIIGGTLLMGGLTLAWMSRISW